MSLPRFHVRTLMILVVIAGVAIWGCVYLSRVVIYDQRSRTFAELERTTRLDLEGRRKIAIALRTLAMNAKAQRLAYRERKDVDSREATEPLKVMEAKSERIAAGYEVSTESLARKADYYGSMTDKYRHATRSAYRPVAPDPPEPE